MAVTAPENPLFTDGDLAGSLRYPVDAAGAVTAERVTWGRIKPILGKDVRPSPLPDELFAIVFQLGILFYENPGLWAKSSTGVDSTDYNTVAQIESLLAELREVVAGTGGTPAPEAGVASPTGGFPPPSAPYPDGAQPSGWVHRPGYW